MRFLRQLTRFLLGEHRPLWGHIDKIRPLSRLLADRAEAVGDGLGVHHHPLPAAIGIVVHLLLLIEGIVPDLVAVHLKRAFALRAPEDAFRQYPVTHLIKQG